MSDQLKISDDALEAAGIHLTSASTLMADDRTETPDGIISSLTGIGDEVQRFLGGMQTARLALADAAKTAAVAAAGVMRDSSELDGRMAEGLYAGFAVTGGGR